jgi:spermidine synthase
MLLVWLAFLLSGIAGLSYELTWVRYLTHLFGASTPAVSATVAIFFTGLALGSAAFGKVFDRAEKPLRAYGLLELCIGASACTVPALFPLADAVLARRSGETSTPLVLALATAILIVPTILLGATFPAMAAVVRHLGNPTRATGLFYGLNTLGAMAGSALVSFIWLPILGPARTSFAMAGINALIAVLMIVLSSRLKARDPAAAPEEDRPPPPKDPLPPALAFTLAAGSGFLSIALEVLLTRALTLVFTATVYVFALTLSAYLIGIALGALAVAAYHRRRAPQPQTLCLLLLLIGLGNLITISLLPELPTISYHVLHGRLVAGWNSYLTFTALTAVACLLPATLTMGAGLPLIVGLSTPDTEHAGRSAGRLYAMNTLAGVFGSLLVTFFLMPWLGLSRSLFLLAMGYIALSLLVGSMASVQPALRRGLVLLLVVGLPIGALGLSPEVNVLKDRPGTKILHFDDAAAGTVAVIEKEQGARALWINNFQTLSDTRATTVEMQYSLGHLPLLLHPDPRRSLLIGFATGTTLSAMTEHPQVQADCVELHDKLPGLAPLFAPFNLEVWKNPRAHIFVDDGRRYLSQQQGTKYDVIVGDLYFPRDVGVGALYSREHFHAARRRLNEGGLLVIWLPLSQLAPGETATVIRSFLEAFPEAEGWIGWWTPLSPALGLVGSQGGLRPRPDLETRLQEHLLASLRKGLPGGGALKETESGEFLRDAAKRGLPVDAPAIQHHRRLLPNALMRKWAEGADLNTLEHPIIEFSAPRSILEQRLHNNPLALQNLRRIAQLRDLKGTPWDGLDFSSPGR